MRMLISHMTVGTGYHLVSAKCVPGTLPSVFAINRGVMMLSLEYVSLPIFNA